MEPRIRLKGFSGEWKTSKYDEVFSLIGDTGHNVQKTEYCERGSYPVVDQSKDYIVGYTDKVQPIDGTNGLIVFGDHTREIKYIDFPFCTGADGTRILKCEQTFDARFMYYVCHSFNIPNTGYNRHFKYIKEAIYKTPETKEEQKAIASYFQHLDSLIQSTTKKIESLKQVKAASLQSMFPQEGETTPLVRFKGFDGEWEDISLGEETYPAGIKNHDNLPLESFSISNEYGFIPQNVQFENGGTMATADKRMYYIVSKNSFGYNPARINVGSLGYYTGEDDVIVSSLYEIFKTSDRICDTFLLYWFKTSKFQKLIEQYQEGGVRFYFFYDKLCMCHTLVPSYEEQQKIADYFTNLDSQITLQAKRIEKLKQIKSACLDNMFV